MQLNRKVIVGPALRWNALQQAATCIHFLCHSHKSTCKTYFNPQRWTGGLEKKEESCLTDRQTEVVHIREINHINEDTWHGGIQTTECGWFLWNWGGTRKVSILKAEACNVEDVYIQCLENDPPSLCVVCVRVCVCVWLGSPLHASSSSGAHVHEQTAGLLKLESGRVAFVEVGWSLQRVI